MREIPLTKGYVALVDDDDFERLNTHRWHASPDGSTVYARRTISLGGKDKTIRMHYEIMRVDGIDHVNGNGLDNRRSNLRIASKSMNAANSQKRSAASSHFKGVSWHRVSQKWQARLKRDYRLIYLGLFRDEVDAATAYNLAAYMEFGEFARFNKPEEVSVATLYDVPERFCSKGHRITGKQELVERGRDGKDRVVGLVNTSVLICETCAWEASGGETLEGTRHRPAKGKKLEKLGQESFLPDAASIFVK
jgi:hypothetical protein